MKADLESNEKKAKSELNPNAQEFRPRTKRNTPSPVSTGITMVERLNILNDTHTAVSHLLCFQRSNSTASSSGAPSPYPNNSPFSPYPPNGIYSRNGPRGRGKNMWMIARCFVVVSSLLFKIVFEISLLFLRLFGLQIDSVHNWLFYGLVNQHKIQDVKCFVLQV